MGEISSDKLAGVSIGASVCTIFLKLGAFFLTNSVSLLSDAMESFVNLLAATITTHIEPLEDPVSWEDTELDRK